MRHVARLGEATAFVSGAALLAGSWAVVAANSRVPDWEADIFQTVNGVSDVVWPVVWAPMQIGSFVGSLVVVGATAFATREPRLSLSALIASQAGFWMAKGIKQLVTRGRPEALLQNVELREQADGLGYISGHATVAFALAAVLAPNIPLRWRPLAFGMAVVVGATRVYAGVHLPLDVVGGAGFGLLCGTFSRWALGMGGEGLPVAHVGQMKS